MTTSALYRIRWPCEEVEEEEPELRILRFRGVDSGSCSGSSEEVSEVDGEEEEEEDIEDEEDDIGSR